MNSDDSDYSACTSGTESSTSTEVEKPRRRTEGGQIGKSISNPKIQITTNSTSNATPFGIRQSLLNFFSPLGPFIAKALSFVQRHNLLDFLPNSLGVDVLTQTTIQPPRYILTENLKRRIKRCNHPSHKNLTKTALIREMPLAYFELYVNELAKDRNLARNEVANANYTMNNQFIKRLTEIEVTAPFNIELKLLTFQEWVDMLLKINKALIKNMYEIETELLLQTQVLVNGNASKTESLDKCRRDITRLVKLIQERSIDGKFNTKNLRLETIKVEDIFGK